MHDAHMIINHDTWFENNFGRESRPFSYLEMHIIAVIAQLRVMNENGKSHLYSLICDIPYQGMVVFVNSK